MLTPLRPFAIALLLFLVFNVGITWITNIPKVQRHLDTWIANRLPEKHELLSQKGLLPIDILALGSSLTDNGFAPPAFEQAAPYPVQVFNMGLSASRYDVLEAVLKYHIGHFGKPRLLLLEVGDFMLEKQDLFSYMPMLYYQTLMTLDPNLQDEIMKAPFLPLEDRNELFFSRLSGLYRYRHLFSPIVIQIKLTKHLQKHFSNGAKRAQPNSDMVLVNTIQEPDEYRLSDQKLKGWHPTRIGPSMQTEAGARLNAMLLKPMHIDTMAKLDFTKLTRLLDYCRTQQIPVVLVQYPMHPQYISILKASGYETPFMDGVDQVAHEYHLPYFNYNRNDFIRQPRWYTDARHLSKVGAIAVSRHLAQDIFSNPELRTILQSQNGQ
jgi:hypothetical protein